MLTVTPLSQDSLLAHPAFHACYSSYHPPPLPKKRKTRRAGRRIRAACDLARNPLPSAPPPTEPIPLLSVDTPTSTPLPSPPKSQKPVTYGFISDLLDLLVTHIAEKDDQVIGEVEELDSRVHRRIRRLEKTILTGDIQLLDWDTWDDFFMHDGLDGLTGDSQYSKSP